MIPVITIVVFVALLYTVMSLGSGFTSSMVSMAPTWWYVFVVGFFAMMFYIGMLAEPVDED